MSDEKASAPRPPGDESPHPKPHMLSGFGRLVDRASYVDIAICATVMLVVSTLYFWAAPDGHGLDTQQDLWGNAFFTLVTFTSLGYGDFIPQGFGRIIAAVDVFSGLTLTAVFIGKVASERQFSMLMLLHTSDTQRRIAGFSDELAAIRSRISRMTKPEDIPDLRDALDQLVRLSRALRSYLVFNSYQAIVLEFGNFTALIGLYDEIRDSFAVLLRLYLDDRSLGDATTMRRLLVSLENLHSVVSKMDILHQQRRPRTSLSRAALQAARLIAPPKPTTAEQSARRRVEALERSLAHRLAAAKVWRDEAFHPLQIERVFDAFPSLPRSAWPTGVHKRVAQTLGISNSVAIKCVDELLSASRLPKRGRADPL